MQFWQQLRFRFAGYNVSLFLPKRKSTPLDPYEQYEQYKHGIAFFAAAQH